MLTFLKWLNSNIQINIVVKIDKPIKRQSLQGTKDISSDAARRLRLNVSFYGALGETGRQAAEKQSNSNSVKMLGYELFFNEVLKMPLLL